MKIAAIILNWNGGRDTLECLASLAKIKLAKTHTIQVIVVDNASTDDSIATIKKKFPKTFIIENSHNIGFSGGNNAGIRYALQENFDYILLLNNDTIIDADCIEQLVVYSKSYDNKGIFGPKIYFYPGCEFHKKRYTTAQRGKVIWYAGGRLDWDNVLPTHRGVDEIDTGQFASESETDFISGCALFAHRSIFEDVGMLDERYFVYYEDIDWSVRAKKLGYQLIFAPHAMVWHKNAGSSGSGSPTHQYYMIRNQLLFGMRHVGIRAKLALIRQSIVILLKGNKWERWGVLDFFSGRLGKTERKV